MYSSQHASLAVLDSQLSQHTSDEYREEILEHIVEVSKSHRPDVTMIDQQPEISWKLWPYLIDVMVDMHTKLKLEPQTLSLAVNIVNRYCARRIVYQKHFHLVGFTAMWIASKYEDKKSAVPTLRLLRHMANNFYPEEMFVMMEGHILNTLEWSISHCGVDSVLKAMLSESSTSPLLMSLTSYIGEITMYHKEFVGYDPLVIARAIHYLSLHLLNVTPPVFENNEENQLWMQWVPKLAEIIVTPPKVILEKYRSSDNHAVTRVVDGWVTRRQRAQEEANAAHARAKAEAQQALRLTALNRQNSTASLPMTPPPSATRTSLFKTHPNSSSTSLPQGGEYMHNNFDINSPASISYSDTDPFTDSPLTENSLATFTSFASATSLNSLPQKLGALHGVSYSPPVTPLNPPKPYFRV